MKKSSVGDRELVFSFFVGDDVFQKVRVFPLKSKNGQVGNQSTLKKFEEQSIRVRARLMKYNVDEKFI